MFLMYLFVCNCTCECMFCVGDHLVQAVLLFVLLIFGKIDNNTNNNTLVAKDLLSNLYVDNVLSGRATEHAVL